MWKNIQGTNYSVSDRGDVRNNKTNKLLKKSKDKDGYLIISLGSKTYRLGRLVLESFSPIGKESNVSYKDGDRNNCSLSNLYWSNELNKIISGEKWKKIFVDNKETWYSVSDYGRIRNDSTKTILQGKFNTKTGYVSAHLRYRTDKYISVHRAVMKAFMPNKEQDVLEVNHKNGIKTDNRLENLEWSTKSENIQHAVKNNLLPNRHQEKVFIYDLSGKFVKESTALELSKELGVKVGAIYQTIDSRNSKYIHGIQVTNVKETSLDPWYRTKSFKECYLYTINGDYIKTYNSRDEASKDLGYSRSYISQIITEKRVVKESFVLLDQKPSN